MALTSSTFLVVTTIQRKSGIERDACQNTWHYIGPSATPTSPDFGNWANNYTAFMGACVGAFSPALSNNPNDVKVQFWLLPNVKGALGAPKMELNTTLPVAALGTPAMPAECALVITLESNLTGIPEQAPGGARPASRRRNRKYLGPLAETMNAEVATINESVPSSTKIDQIQTAWHTHMNAAQITNGWVPVTFSRFDWAAFPVVNTWIDDAWDTQRRRGNDPLLKHSKPVTP